MSDALYAAGVRVGRAAQLAREAVDFIDSEIRLDIALVKITAMSVEEAKEYRDSAAKIRYTVRSKLMQLCAVLMEREQELEPSDSVVHHLGHYYR